MRSTVEMGHEPPRQLKSLATDIPLITDAKADDWRGGSGPQPDSCTAAKYLHAELDHFIVHETLLIWQA
jgi:hypothetical protein